MVSLSIVIALIVIFFVQNVLGFLTPLYVRNQSYGMICLYAGKDDEQQTNNSGGGFMQGISNFFQELDNFMDDASARRLGNGAAFYGKRKSNFYGKNDKYKKGNSNLADPTEDYQAPNTGGYFQWMPDEDGQLRPVTRLKKQNVERNPKFWDRLYNNNEEQETK